MSSLGTIFLVVEEGSSPRKFLNVPLKRHISTHLRILPSQSIHYTCPRLQTIYGDLKMTKGRHTSPMYSKVAPLPLPPPPSPYDQVTILRGMTDKLHSSNVP